MTARRRILDHLFSPLLIVGVVAALYGHTLHAPFYLDDQWAIVDRYLLRDLAETARRLFMQRGLTNLTLAINLRMSGLELLPLHLTNIALHAGCGVLSWLVLRKLVEGQWRPLLGALLFVAHPLQTQAVTYLIQRATVLGSLFFLLAFLFHLRAREALARGSVRTDLSYLCPWLISVLAGAAAVLSKENTATLPLVLIAYDQLFPLSGRQSLRQAVAAYAPYFVVPLLLGVKTLNATLASPDSMSTLASMQGNDPLHYLVTQFSVIWHYLRLLLFPVGQALEYDYQVVQQLLSVQTFFAFTGLVVLAWLAWRARRSHPLLAFGMVWFFLALAVESSIIPLDPLFEHRLYLPMFGFILVLLAGLSLLRGDIREGGFLAAVLLLCFPLTWQRNAMWNEPIAFYEDNLRQIPQSERASETLAGLYAQAGRYEEERELLEATLRRYPDNFILYVNLAKTYAEEHRIEEAFSLLETGIKRLPGRAAIYETAAEIAKRERGMADAIAYLQRGLGVVGADRGRLWNDLGVLYSEAGDSQRAVQAFYASLDQDDADPGVWLNLGKEYYLRRQWPEAVSALRRSLELEPGNPEALEGLGQSSLATGDAGTARWAAEKLRYSDPNAWRRLQSAIDSMPGQMRPTERR